MERSGSPPANICISWNCCSLSIANSGENFPAFSRWPTELILSTRGELSEIVMVSPYPRERNLGPTLHGARLRGGTPKGRGPSVRISVGRRVWRKSDQVVTPGSPGRHSGARARGTSRATIERPGRLTPSRGNYTPPQRLVRTRSVRKVAGAHTPSRPRTPSRSARAARGNGTAPSAAPPPSDARSGPSPTTPPSRGKRLPSRPGTRARRPARSRRPPPEMPTAERSTGFRRSNRKLLGRFFRHHRLVARTTKREPLSRVPTLSRRTRIAAVVLIGTSPSPHRDAARRRSLRW